MPTQRVPVIAHTRLNRLDLGQPCVAVLQLDMCAGLAVRQVREGLQDDNGQFETMLRSSGGRVERQKRGREVFSGKERRCL